MLGAHICTANFQLTIKPSLEVAPTTLATLYILVTVNIFTTYASNLT